MSASARAHAKLAAARARLALERPFLGALVIHLPVVASERCRTIATDTRAIHFNPAYVGTLDLAETQFMLAHEALHCALQHGRRRGPRLRARWDLACDYAVNQLLVDDGLRAPLAAVRNPAYRGLSAEAIYPLLEDTPAAERIDEHWFGEGRGAHGSGPIDLAIDRPRALEDAGDAAHLDAHRDGVDELATRAPSAALGTTDDWQHRLAASAIEAAQAGRLGAHWRGVLAELVQPRLPWRALLARFLASLVREDWSFARPSRRSGDAILPGAASTGIELVVALDTSGSITRDDFRAFAAELDALKGQIRADVTLLACDAALAPEAPWRFAAWEPLRIPADLAGGGSTRFTPVFDWVREQGARPAALAYFTDALGEFPPLEPDYPVLWLVKGSAPVPWGERVQLN